MKLYALLVVRQLYDAPRVSIIPLVTLDIKQAVNTAKNIHQLCIPFDHGGTVSVYEMEAGTIMSRNSFDLSMGIPPHYPVVFQRTKDTDGEWTDEWLSERAKADYYAATA